MTAVRRAAEPAMPVWGLEMCCAECGDDLDLLARSTAAGTTTNAAVVCTGCGCEFVVLVQLRRMLKAESQRRTRYRKEVPA